MVKLAPCSLGGFSEIVSPASGAKAPRMTPQHIGILWFWLG
jgi:hypothetical protein